MNPVDPVKFGVIAATNVVDGLGEIRYSSLIFLIDGTNISTYLSYTAFDKNRGFELKIIKLADVSGESKIFANITYF
jgi:hypothetical protein